MKIQPSLSSVKMLRSVYKRLVSSGDYRQAEKVAILCKQELTEYRTIYNAKKGKVIV